MRPVFRIVQALFGVIFAVAGGYGLMVPQEEKWLVAAGLVFLAAGVEAIVASVRGRLSLLGRVGPLP